MSWSRGVDGHNLIIAAGMDSEGRKEVECFCGIAASGASASEDIDVIFDSQPGGDRCWSKGIPGILKPGVLAIISRSYFYTPARHKEQRKIAEGRRWTRSPVQKTPAEIPHCSASPSPFLALSISRMYSSSHLSVCRVDPTSNAHPSIRCVVFHGVRS